MAREKGTYGTLNNWVLKSAPRLPLAAGWVLIALDNQSNYASKTLSIADLCEATGREGDQVRRGLALLAEYGVAVQVSRKYAIGTGDRIEELLSSLETRKEEGIKARTYGRLKARKEALLNDLLKENSKVASTPSGTEKSLSPQVLEVLEVLEVKQASRENDPKPCPPEDPETYQAGGLEIDLDDLFGPTPDLPSQEENNLEGVPPETHPANSAQSTVPGRGAAAGGEAANPDAAAQVFFHDLAGPRLTNIYAAKVPKWAAEYTPEFIRLAWDYAPMVKGAHLAIHAFAWLLNREREWPEALQRQYKADLKTKHVAPADRVPVIGEILVCGPNSGKVLEVLHADRLVSIQTGPGLADYLTVPWASTQPAVRRSA